MNMRIAVVVSVLLLACAGAGAKEGASMSGGEKDMAGNFKAPTLALHPMPLLWLNGLMTTEDLKAQLRDGQGKSGFGGVAPLPMGSTQPKYLTDDYFARYGDILETSRELGMEVVLYDDNDFPSGSAGGRMAKLNPDYTVKRLDLSEEAVNGPARCEKSLPAGKLMGVVALNTQTWQRIDISSSAVDGKLSWQAPAGTWQVMIFTCVKSGNHLVDFLSPEAVDKLIPLTYGEYYKRFEKHFGTTIRRSFFDDVGFYAQHRPWTLDFNEKFKRKLGYSPVALYPALWRDIGPDTAAARAALFGFRAELLAEGYPARVGEWCRKHGLQSSGHPPGNYDPCPVDMHFDTFKFYRHVDIPLMDAIFCHGHGRPGFKLISSAATMYDRPLVAAEEYGAYAEKSFDADMLYRTGMELFARGVNRVIPHGMWLDPKRVSCPPLISDFSEKLAPALPDYSLWSARCSLLLQGGRSVVDLAMFYPIASLEAWYYFDAPANAGRWGQFIAPECDYQSVSDILSCNVRRDFTFLHPDALDEKCVRRGAELHLKNKNEWQDYKVLIIPGGKVIPWASLKKIRDFYNHGGKVVATTCLPEKSAELGRDSDVKLAVKEMFGVVQTNVPTGAPVHVRIEVAGDVIKTLVNDTLVDTRSDGSFRSGRIGFREATKESACFSNVKVTAPDGKVLFSDDCRGGFEKWSGAGNASLGASGVCVTENENMRSSDGETWTDYALDVDIASPGGVAGLVFRSVDDRNCYMWQFRPAARQIVPHKMVNGGWQGLPGISLSVVDYSVRPFSANPNKNGGKAYFAPSPTAGTLRAILDDAVPVPDVAIDSSVRVESGKGGLSYLHKVKDGRNIYYVANSSNERVETDITIRGRMALECWNPHDGSMVAAGTSDVVVSGQPCTRVRVKLEPVKSVFLVEKAATN